jgi:DNA-binding transcriptional ArsR family regulator
MEPTDSRPAATLPSGLGSATDRLICDLLAAEPMTSPDLAARLAIPARTVRHRLMRLRDAGAVTVGADGLYRAEALAVQPSPAVAASGASLTAASATPATSGNGAGLVIIGALAACCVGVIAWAARHRGSFQAAGPVSPVAPPSPAIPAYSPGWPYSVGWSGPSSWQR